MLQGVREVFELVDLEQANAETGGKIVLIGKGIRGMDFEGSLARALREVGD